ncbi:MAG: ArsA family ATPase [Desulfobacterales bacterium]
MNNTIADFFKEHPQMRYIYFGGKGGVGKTVVAAAVANWMGQQGKKTLLASTNPVHSLSNLFKLDVFGKPTPIPGTDNLYVQEIDTKDTIEKSKVEIREKISWFLKFADIPTKAEDFIESATMNPAFEESAMFENMINIIFEDAYDFYVFDTAPTANARRLLGMSKVYTLWVDKMMKSRDEAKSMRLSLSFRKKKVEEEEDPLLEYLKTFRDRIDKMRVICFIGWFEDFGIPIGGVVINQAIDRSQIGEDSAEFIKNRVKMQNRYREEANSLFKNICGEIPLFEKEVRGIEMVGKVTESLFQAA